MVQQLTKGGTSRIDNSVGKGMADQEWFDFHVVSTMVLCGAIFMKYRRKLLNFSFVLYCYENKSLLYFYCINWLES